MEKAIFISDPADLKHFFLSRFGRIYFGNEFCPNLMPTPKQLGIVMRFAAAHEAAFTLVTPIFRNDALPELLALLRLLPEKTEVVFNDWGLAEHIANQQLTPVHGRLLCAVNRDPRIPEASGAMGYFRANNMRAPYLGLLADRGVARFELDNVPQGYDIAPAPPLPASLYYPYVYSTVTRKCIFANMREKPGKFKIVEDCGRDCAGRTIKTKVDGRDVFIEGNAQFFINAKQPATPEAWGVDRTVFMPVFPNHNSFIEDKEQFDWSYPYKRGGLEQCWGETPDATAGGLVAELAGEGGGVLDIGCGTGKHSLLFAGEKWNYTGIDFAEKAIEIARSNYPDRRFIFGDLFEIQGLDHGFDLLLDYGCFHTIAPWMREKYFAVAARIARPGAHFILASWESVNTETPILYVHDRLPEWGCSREKIEELARGAFDVLRFESRQEWGRNFLYAVMRRKQ